jgi:hypothetical protein
VKNDDTFIVSGQDYISEKPVVCILERDDSISANDKLLNVAEIGTSS